MDTRKVVVFNAEALNDTIESALSTYAMDGYFVIDNVVKGDKRFITLELQV